MSVDGTTSQRGYGYAHKKLRAEWDKRVRAGGVHCAKCGHPIAPDAPFHLGHTDDRTGYLGPEHPYCSSADGGRRRGRTKPPARNWTL